MNEDQEMERFGMDNDYEDGQWIGGEFYGKRKQKHTQTKDDVLYGVFASGDSDSDYEASGSRKRRKELSKKIDYSKPVNFISTGSVMPSQEIDRYSKKDKETQFISVSSENTPCEEEESEEYSFLPTAFGKQIQEKVLRKEKEKKKKSLQTKKSSQAVKGESDLSGVATFEKHTKGIGTKLLKKMCYKGGGLGKNEQGITAPIEAMLRPRKWGLGFDDYKDAVPPPLQELYKLTPKPPSQSLEGRSNEKRWSRKSLKRKDNKQIYITAEQLLAQKQEQGFEVVQKIFDMRGPQVRVITNLENLNAEDRSRENDVPMPELQHNVRLVVDSAELDIQKLDNDLRNERETVVALQKGKEKLEKDACRQKQQLDNIEVIMGMLDQINELSSSGTLTLEYLTKSFVDLQMTFADDYTLCNLSCIACSYALPLFIRIFQGWDPLQKPTHGVEVVSVWKKLLQGKDSLSFSSTASPYMQLLMEVVFPAVRISGTNSWHARDPEPMLSFLESWEELLPPVVL